VVPPPDGRFSAPPTSDPDHGGFVRAAGWKEQFRLPEGASYLNCAFTSPLLRSVEEAATRALRRLRFPARLSGDDFFAESDTIRDRFARLVGGEARQVALVPSVSYGAAIVARNLEAPPGSNVVVAGEQFPSNVYPWTRWAAEKGAEMRTVARPLEGGAEGKGGAGPDGAGPDGAASDGSGPGGGTGGPWTEEILKAMDRNTALVALPQAHWTDGTLLDLEAVGRRAREVDAAFVVDGTQTVGAHPFRVDRIRPDALLCAGYKWLLGPYGLGVAWFGERFADARPLEETWLGRRGSEDFAGLVDYTDAYREGADRLDVGERSHFVLAPMLAEALRRLLEWGVDTVADHTARLTSRAASGAREMGFRSEPDAGRCSNIVGLGTPAGTDATRLARELEARDVHVSRRGDALRISPHLYNDEADVEALLEGLEASNID
jgi:selenocysteine lyase/cysteine desulfurase